MQLAPDGVSCTQRPAAAGSSASTVRLASLLSTTLDPGNVGASSRVPGGAFAHGVVGRLLRRHLNTIGGRFDGFKEIFVDELGEVRKRLTMLEETASLSAGHETEPNDD